VRGLVTGTVCGLGALVAHQLAGGDASPLLALAVWPLSVVLCLGLVGHRVRPGRLTAVALATQLGWHELLSLAGAHAGAYAPRAADMSGMHDMAHMGHTDHMAHMTHMTHMARASADAAHVHGPMSGDGSMLLAHLLVVVATVVLAVGAERAVLRFFVGLVLDLLLPRLPRPAGPLPVRRRVVAVTTGVRPHGRTGHGPATLRGPPLVLA